MRLIVLLLLPALLSAQLEVGLSAYYPFELSLGDASGEPTNLGSPEGAVDYECGVIGSSILLTGPDDFVRIPGGASNNVNRVFNDDDFSVSLYFKPLSETGGEQFLMAKRDTACGSDAPDFFVQYNPGTRQLTAEIRGASGLRSELVYTLDNLSCWQHLVIVREDVQFRLYINGLLVSDTDAPQRLNIDNPGDLLIGAGACPAPGVTSFSGLIDELRVYNRSLLTSEVQQLYLFPDRILTPDQTRFLGQGVEVQVNSNCGTTFSWTPPDPVASPDEAEPTITPVTAGRRKFQVRIQDGLTSCIASDTLILQVIDPEGLDCGTVFLPKAFTPNGIGPVQNETFGIANPFAVGELVSFEIYDRYGEQVFRTDDQFGRWDGTFRGQAVNAGVMLWRVVYRCEEEEIVRSGSVTVLR